MHKVRLDPGIVSALLSAVLFGASVPLAKLLTGQIPPVLLAGLLYLGSGIGLLALFGLGRRRGAAGQAHAFTLRDSAWLGGAIVFGGIIGPVLLMLGLTRTPAASASLLLNLEGLATMTIAWLAFHENVDRRLLLGAFSILAGAALLSWHGAGSLQPGALLIAAACLCWGIDNNLTRKLSFADPVQIAMLKGLAAGSFNLALALGNGASLPPPATVLGACVIGFLGYGVSLAMFVLALRHLGTARAGAYFSMAPFVGAMLAIVLLHEPAPPILAPPSTLSNRKA